MMAPYMNFYNILDVLLFGNNKFDYKASWAILLVTILFVIDSQLFSKVLF